MKAEALHRALKELGSLPKTYELQTVITGVDTVTGKKKSSTDVSKHAPVAIKSGRYSVTVDFYKLRDLCQKIRKKDIYLTLRGEDRLIVRYEHGEFTLVHIPAKPAASVDLDRVVL